MVPSLCECIYEYLQNDIDLLLRKIKLVERHDIRLDFVENLYLKFIEQCERTEIEKIINLYFDVSYLYPRTKRLIYDSLKNSISKNFILGNSSLNFNYRTLNCSIINNLMRFTEKKFYELLQCMLNSRDLSFYEKDQKLIWNYYPSLNLFIYNTLMNRISEMKCHFCYGIYFKYSSHMNVDIAPYFIQDSETLNNIQTQYSTSNYMIYGYHHNSINLSENNRRKLWIAALCNECYIQINSNSYRIYAFNEIIEEIFVSNIIRHEGMYKLFSHFENSIENVRQSIC